MAFDIALGEYIAKKTVGLRTQIVYILDTRFLWFVAYAISIVIILQVFLPIRPWY